MNAQRQVHAALDPGLTLELRWLDVLIHREILRLRASYHLSLDEFRGLYISDEQVDALVRESLEEATGERVDLDARAAEYRVDRVVVPTSAPFAYLAREFRLSRVEQDLLLIAAAPELDSKYETLFAYLNNDVSKKGATIALMCRLLANGEQPELAIRAALLPRSPLFASELLRPAPSERGASINATVQAHRSVPTFMLGLGVAEFGTGVTFMGHVQLQQRARWIAPEARARARYTARAWVPTAEQAPIWLLRSRDPALRGSAAASLAHDLGLHLLRLDCASLAGSAEELVAAFRAALMQQRLCDASLLVVGLESHTDGEGRLTPEMKTALRKLSTAQRPVLIECEHVGEVEKVFANAHVIGIDIPELPRAERAEVWRESLHAQGLDAPVAVIAAVSDQFALTIPQIERAVQAIIDAGAADGLQPHSLAAAARAASDRSLVSIAQRLQLPFDFADLILPGSARRRLQEIVQAIRHRHLVLGDWGLHCHAGGFGLRVMFSGPSGTGKTMAVAAIGRTLGVDVYRIDISQTVSKYIGETEKNLDKIFHAAAYSNAILFFDEADALFGKRSDVKDAHDRYSNIETAYLLQKVEEYQGVVLLATNLSRNLDNAFSRRLNFVLEFPLPERPERVQLWQAMLKSLPTAADVDVEFLGSQFVLSGGEIRNVVLDAAFLAAQSREQRVTMRHLIIALGRQFTKQGRAPTMAEFKHHHELLTHD